jgi:long-chain acyl-CoA synthetase
VAQWSFWQAAQRDPDHLALVEPDGHELTAGELLGEANRIVHGLRAKGLAAGDTVATLLPNSAAMMATYLACLQAGWYLVPINYHLTGQEIGYILKDSEARSLVCSSRFAAAGLEGATVAGLPEDARFAVGESEGFQPYGSLLEGQPGALPDDRSPGAVMNYTAGTTGRPKGVKRAVPPLDPDTVAEMFASFQALFGIMPADDNVHLVVSPLYHTAVLTFASAAQHLGHTVVLMDKWTPQGTLERIEKYRVTTSHMVPTQFVRLLALPDEIRGTYDVSSTRVMVHSAAPCPVDVKQQMLDWWGPVIYEYYAATEGGGTLATPEEWLKRPGTVGTPWPMSEIRILDDDGLPVGAGQPGTVWIRMGDYTFEYHKDREKTEQSWREGFFTVGDVGYLDEEGYLFLNDRKADMIISGGVNIYPAEVENALILHPKVADVAVFGIPNDDWGEEVKAVVQPASGVTPGAELEEELIAFGREKVAAYKAPRSVDFVDELPRDPNGKLYKRKLRDPYWQGRERAI